jgi:hypothetical protein
VSVILRSDLSAKSSEISLHENGTLRKESGKVEGTCRRVKRV